jgi:phospholipid/cholesterol/gamma-HCH transport system substrate-binding protein
MNRVKINMIAFLVLSLGFTYWLATQVLSSLQERIQVYVMLDDAGGVFTSQEVTYRGLTVGQVGTMSVVHNGVKLELNINAENNIPKEDIEARVMFKSAVGEQFVDLLPGTNSPPYLQDGDVIPKEQTSIPVSTQELLTTVEAVLRGVPPEDLKGAIDALGGGLTGRGPDIATIIEATADIAEVFAERGQEIEGILKNGTRFGRAFLDSKEEFAEAVHQLVTVSESLASSTPDLERLMRGGNTTSKEVVSLLRKHDTGVNRFLHEFAEVNELQAQHGDDIAQLLKFLPDGLLGVVRTFEPETGLVRFSLVEDSENPACSYGTGRRPPSDRTTGLPPKDARCGRAGGNAAQTQAAGKRTDPASNRANEPLVPGLNVGDDLNGDAPVLPPRMAEWSWTLFYLNSV